MSWMPERQQTQELWCKHEPRTPSPPASENWYKANASLVKKEELSINMGSLYRKTDRSAEQTVFMNFAVHSQNPGEGGDNLQTGQPTPKAWEEADGFP